MDRREQFLNDLQDFYNRYEQDDGLNDALAVLALLGAAVCVEAEEAMVDAITPLAHAFIVAHDAARAALN